MLAFTLLLALTFLVPASLAQPHSIPRRHPHLAGPPSAREIYAAAAKNTHVASRRSFNDNVKAMEGMKMVRRKKKRSCAAQNPVLLGSNNATTSTSALGDRYHAQPSLTSSVGAAPSETSDESETWSSAPSSSSAAASPEPTSGSGSSSDGLVRLLASLFPDGKGSADWSTSPDSPNAMSFNDALKPLAAGKLPMEGSAPDDSNALIARYPAGTVKYSSSTGHGYSFYSTGDKNNIYVEGAKEVMFSYSVYFDAGFDFVKGGKLPGLYGGTDADSAKSCSGGRQDNRDSCFSARLMWRTDGAGEIYNYLPQAAYANTDYCTMPPMSKCDTTFGDSIGRGSFTWATGQWTTVAMRLKLNDANVANGEQELFVNGQSIMNINNLMISVNSETKIYGIMAQTFFGGGDSSWASPKDQNAYFKDWSMAVLA